MHLSLSLLFLYSPADNGRALSVCSPLLARLSSARLSTLCSLRSVSSRNLQDCKPALRQSPISNAACQLPMPMRPRGATAAASSTRAHLRCFIYFMTLYVAGSLQRAHNKQGVPPPHAPAPAGAACRASHRTPLLCHTIIKHIYIYHPPLLLCHLARRRLEAVARPSPRLPMALHSTATYRGLDPELELYRQHATGAQQPCSYLLMVLSTEHHAAPQSAACRRCRLGPPTAGLAHRAARLAVDGRFELRPWARGGW